MAAAESVTLTEFILALRQRLVDAVQTNDQETIAQLLTTFGILVDTSYSVQDHSVTELLVFMEDSARNALMGVAWKAPIPSVDAVESALRKS